MPPKGNVQMERPDEIEPMVPELPHDVRTDGGRPHGRRTPTFDDAESDAPLVPDLT